MADVRDSHGQHDLQIGQLALERGYITQDQLRGALAEQARDLEQGRPARTLPKIFIDKGYLTQRQVVSLNSGDEKTAPKRKLINKPFGRYTLLRELGRGGMGIVYEAYDTSVERKVALKVMIPHPDAEPEEAKTEEERFIRETKLTARLPNHANIVSVYDGGVIERRRYITMEYIEGQRFDTWRKTSHTTTKQQIAVLRDVIRAVHHAHESKIFHRDLKPANILVDTDNQPRVTDFGLAKIADDNSRATLTASGMVIGTPVYMSPEQAKGRRDIDYRTDIYSLGVMLYEVLTNRVPFDGAQAIAILHKHVHERALLPSHCVRGIDQGIENICMKALEKKPAMRYQKAKDLADDITRWLNGDFVRTPEPTRRRVAHAPKKSFAWIYGLAAALIIGILAIVALTSNSRPDVASNPKVGPAPKPGPKNPRTPVRKPPPKHPGLAALKAAREHGDKTTADVIAKLKLYDSAKWNLADQPELDGAQKERNALSEKLQQMFAEEFQEALKDIVPPITREEYQTALDRLEKTKRRYAQPAWTRLVENETFTLQRDIKKQYDLLKHKAIKAKLDGSDKEVKTHVDRVGKWGITLYINHLRNHLSGIETPDPPEPAPPVAAINPSSVNRGNASTNPQITGLIAHWKLDETYGENVKDSSGNRNNGKLKQGAKWTKGRIGGAASFDGIDDYIDLPHTRLLNTVQQNSYTLSAWFSPDGIPRKKSKPADSQEYGIIIKRGNEVPQFPWTVETGSRDSFLERRRADVAQ